MTILVIAEGGVNHNGSEELALELVDAAYEAGADVVKFQTFKASKLVTPFADQATYQTANIGRAESQLAMLSRLELSFDAHRAIVERCQKLGIEFLSTAFDFESLSFLAYELQLRRLKIPSGELTNAPLVLAHARTGRDLIVSTGMATLADIEIALGVIAFGYIAQDGVPPSLQAFAEAYRSTLGQAELKSKVTLLHCTTEYPAPLEDINLAAMRTMESAFKLPVGYSDHSAGIAVSIAAAALGAVVIEKHFTLDRRMEGPDHQASLEPGELAALVNGVRSVDRAIGDGLKRVTDSEVGNIIAARKSIVAVKAIQAGELYSEENLGVMRPGNGISPLRYWSFIGQRARCDYLPGELIGE